MIDMILILLLVLIVAVASWYVVREKKKGKTCIGCPGGGCGKCASQRKNKP